MLCHFGPFFDLSPPDNLENQNFEKLKKIPGDIIILYNCHCTKNEVFLNGKLYFLCSVYQKGKKWQWYGVWFPWDKECSRQNFSHFGTSFALLTPPTSLKDPENQNILNSWDMEWVRQNILSFWTVFCPFTPLWTQKIKILKKPPPPNKHLEILSF